MVKRQLRLSSVFWLLSLLASPAWARYRPANWESLPMFPTMGYDDCYVTLTNENYKADGTYKIEEKYKTDCQPLGAIRFGDTVNTVTVWMTANTKISAYGLSSSAADSKCPGGAGINLPSGKTLVFRCVDEGSAYVYAKGGDGGDPSSGANGRTGYATDYAPGGAGGRGADAAGAGIGGNGGAAGAAGERGESNSNGGQGGNGGDGGDCGTVWCYDGVHITAEPGNNSTKTVSGGKGGTDQSAGGGGGGGSGGFAGASPSIGMAGGGGGGGGGGSGASWTGGGGGGGGAHGGFGGDGGPGHGTSGRGEDGEPSDGNSGGTGGSGGDDSSGGKGGDSGNSGTNVRGGFVWCASTDQLKISKSVTGPGCGAASTVTAVPVALEFNLDFIEPSSSNAADTNVLYETNDQGLRTLHASAIAPPQPKEGWMFSGYYTEKTGGDQVVASDGLVVTPKVTFTGSTLYAHLDAIPVEPAAGAFKTNAIPYEIVATVTDAPDRQDTYCTWYYRKTGTSDWISFIPSGATRDPLATGDSVTVSAEVLPEESPSGLYDFQCRLVTTRWGNGQTLTNVCSGAARFNYVRRDPPEYDAANKTLWANGSALKILRDTRDEKSVIVYWDRTWDGACENAFKRGMKLSADGWWVNGGFRDGAEVGGGVKIDFVSGEVYGIDAGDNIVEGLREAGKVTLTQGADAKIGAGGKRNW